ncbi:hypothetical protein QQ045_031990 [Rhodiola kirilowii]
MELAKARGLSSAVFLSDSLGAILSILKGNAQMETTDDWVRKCFSYLETFSDWSMEHIMREDNKTADWLANYARVNKWECKSLCAVPIVCGDQGFRETLKEEDPV